MSTFHTDGFDLHYELVGDSGAPCVVLSNSLGTGLAMWAPQMPALLARFRVLRYDTRGHGASGVPPGPYRVEQLGADVLALMDHCGIARAHFCGLSMGGMTGLWLGVHHPERLLRLALCNTAAKIGTAEIWNARIAAVESGGMAAIVDGVLERWLTAPFRQRAPAAAALLHAMLLATPPAGYIAACAAVRDMDQRHQVAAIRLPTLVIAGSHDLATPPQDGRAIADAILDAHYAELDAAHLSNIEQAAAFSAALTDFLTQGAKHG